jgi:DUF4097 and DUF4098 domain-containing protein YvlB
MHTFETPRAPIIELVTGAGHVTVNAVEGTSTTVDLVPLDRAAEELVAEAHVEQRNDSIIIDIPRRRGLLRQSPRVAVTVTCPWDSALQFEADSADLQTTGALSKVSAMTGSGDIALEEVTGQVRAKTGSGTISAGRVDGQLQMSTGSGNVAVDRSTRSAVITAGSGDISIGELAGETTTKTGSGDVEVGVLDGALLTKTGSGNLTVRRASSGSVRATGASGNISIGIKEGTAAWLDVSTVSGRCSQELAESEAPRADQRRVEITAQTVSGDVRVHRS